MEFLNDALKRVFSEGPSDVKCDQKPESREYIKKDDSGEREFWKERKQAQRECWENSRWSRLADLRTIKEPGVLGELLVWLNSLNDVRDEFWFSEGVGGSVEEYEQGKQYDVIQVLKVQNLSCAHFFFEKW